MASLFGRDVKTIGKHINNALKEELSYMKSQTLFTASYAAFMRARSSGDMRRCSCIRASKRLASLPYRIGVSLIGLAIILYT